jgi:osmotically-inducible protein OsmY
MPTMRMRSLSAVPLCGVLVVACGHTDPATQVAIDNRLSADPITAPLGLDAAVSRGVVRLEGEVDSADQRRRAMDVTRGVPGVKAVVDAMYVSDAFIIAAVKQALAADSLVGRIPFTVSASHGRVQLISDQTGPDDRARALAIASAVDGVTHVDDLMR